MEVLESMLKINTEDGYYSYCFSPIQIYLIIFYPINLLKLYLIKHIAKDVFAYTKMFLLYHEITFKQGN